uniref:Fibrinogen C-terminal domain-containing protein n=1 Tax=Ciona savignyi TaxID=51511 RepID=H2Z1Z2_CIOSA
SCKKELRLGHNESGIQGIYNPGSQKILEVYCDQTTDGGGWMVFQRRRDGSEDFYRTWVEYQGMFGNLSNEFWLGNENLHALTRHGYYELRIELEDCANVKKFATYSSFSIGSAQENYTLKVSGYSGNAGKTVNKLSLRDSLSYHNGQPFSTKDVDNDSQDSNCAEFFHGAWWYKGCHQSNNGEYLRCQTTTSRAASWGAFNGLHYSMKFIEMKFRPRED